MAIFDGRNPFLPHSLYGYILQWQKALDGKPSVVELLSDIKEIQRAQLKDDTGFWTAYRFVGDRPMSRIDEIRLEDFFEAIGADSEADNELEDPRPFRYKFLFRFNPETGMAAIASESREVSARLYKTVLNSYLSPNLFPVQVLIKDLAEHFIFKSDGRYKMSYISADFIDGGADLEKVTLYGKDIGNSVFVSEHIHRMSATQIGMRASSEFKENAQFGKDGYIRFYPRQGVGLKRFESCLSYIAAHNFFIFPS